MLRNMMCGLAALAFVATPALAQDTDGGAQVAAESFATAEAEGIPLSLLESKLAEGQAKGVPIERIEAAIEQRTDALVRASNALARAGVSGAGEAELSVGADALEGGVSAEVLEAVSASAPQERRTVAIAALTHLVAEGIASAEALARVEGALDRGPQALADLAAQAGVAADAGVDADGVGAGVGAGASGEASGGAGVPDVVPPTNRP